MADPKAPREERDAPYFPPPRKQEKPSPYRKAAAAPPVSIEPPEKAPVVVSRPEPPAPIAPERRSAMKPRPPMALVEPPIGPIRSTVMTYLLRRYPRLVGLAFFLLGGWMFENDVVSDYTAIASRGYHVFVHKDWSFQLSLGIAAFGLWLSIWGIPMDEKTGRPRDWWSLGLFLFLVFAIAGRPWLTDLALALFA